MQRIKTRAQYQAAMAGRTVARTAHFALHRLALDALESSETAPPGPEPSPDQALFAVRETWIGAVVPKRWARRAVTRNAIKRQIYTVSQTVQPGLPAAAHVVRLRSGFDRAVFRSATSDALKLAVREELISLFGRAAA